MFRNRGWFSRLALWGAIASASAFFTAGTIAVATESPERGTSTPATASGAIHAIDYEQKVIAVRTADGSVRFKATDRTNVSIDGEAARFEQLRVGMTVRVSYDAATQIALRIAASTPSAGTSTVAGASGRISHLHPEWIGLVTEEGRQVRFRVTERTGVTIDGAAARYSDLVVGMGVRISFDSSTMTALRIAAASQ